MSLSLPVQQTRSSGISSEDVSFFAHFNPDNTVDEHAFYYQVIAPSWFLVGIRDHNRMAVILNTAVRKVSGCNG
jgi:hypothetical protein